MTAHIPPGVHTPSRVVWFHDEFSEPFNSALREFADVIVGMHFGHDHGDSFKVFYDKQGQVRLASETFSLFFFLSPSLSLPPALSLSLPVSPLTLSATLCLYLWLSIVWSLTGVGTTVPVTDSPYSHLRQSLQARRPFPCSWRPL